MVRGTCTTAVSHNFYAKRRLLSSWRCLTEAGQLISCVEHLPFPYTAVPVALWPLARIRCRATSTSPKRYSSSRRRPHPHADPKRKKGSCSGCVCGSYHVLDGQNAYTVDRDIARQSNHTGRQPLAHRASSSSSSPLAPPPEPPTPFSSLTAQTT